MCLKYLGRTSFTNFSAFLTINASPRGNQHTTAASSLVSISINFRGKGFDKTGVDDPDPGDLLPTAGLEVADDATDVKEGVRRRLCDNIWGLEVAEPFPTNLFVSFDDEVKLVLIPPLPETE